MDNKCYQYTGSQEQADDYLMPIPIIGNIYSSDAKIGGRSVDFWVVNSDDDDDYPFKEWKLVEKEQSTNELIELLNKQAAKDGMICTVTFENKPEVEITDFYIGSLYNGMAMVSFSANLQPSDLQIKKPQLIEAIKTVLEND